MNYGYVDVSVLPLFLAAVVLIDIAPGPDMAYMVGAGIADGRSAATRAALGVSLGVVLFTVAVAAGLGAVVARHPGVLTGLEIFGALCRGALSGTSDRRLRAPSAAPGGRVLCKTLSLPALETGSS